MSDARFSFALEHLKATDWRRFERLASSFLVTDFGTLRTVASPSGDRGRDAELFSPESEPTVVLQYSVTKDFASKIRATAKRVRDECPAATVLVYVTNQEVGAHADAVKAEVRRKYSLSVDVRDRYWFLERVSTSVQREALAEEFAEEVADPI